MTDPTTVPPQVEAYLAELGAHLGGTDPATRADTIQGVREHIQDALAAAGPDPTAGQVRAILDRLGPAADVAGTAEPGTGRRSSLAGGWVAPVVLLLQLVGIAGSVFFLPVVGLVAACVLVILSPLWKPWEKIASIVASVAGLVLFVVALAAAMFVANDCYDEATGQGMDAGRPIEGLDACSDVSSVDAGGVLLVGLGALTVAVLIVLTIRAARRVDRVV